MGNLRATTSQGHYCHSAQRLETGHLRKHNQRPIISQQHASERRDSWNGRWQASPAKGRICAPDHRRGHQSGEQKRRDGSNFLRGRRSLSSQQLERDSAPSALNDILYGAAHVHYTGGGTACMIRKELHSKAFDKGSCTTSSASLAHLTCTGGDRLVERLRPLPKWRFWGCGRHPADWCYGTTRGFSSASKMHFDSFAIMTLAQEHVMASETITNGGNGTLINIFNVLPILYSPW